MADVGAILIADDEETFRESTCRLLRREGFDCRCAKDGEEAVESLRRGRFDLLVADIRMPRNSDLRVVREARHPGDRLPLDRNGDPLRRDVGRGLPDQTSGL